MWLCALNARLPKPTQALTPRPPKPKLPKSQPVKAPPPTARAKTQVDMLESFHRFQGEKDPLDAQGYRVSKALIQGLRVQGL